MKKVIGPADSGPDHEYRRKNGDTEPTCSNSPFKPARPAPFGQPRRMLVYSTKATAIWTLFWFMLVIYVIDAPLIIVAWIGFWSGHRLALLLLALLIEPYVFFTNEGIANLMLGFYWQRLLPRRRRAGKALSKT